jgi:Fic family protein
MLAAAGGTYQAEEIDSDRLTAHVAGTPYDKARLDVFDEAVRELETLAPTILQATGADEEERRWLPFFEAYFSNYIEGTKFSVEEAKDIAIRGIESVDRPPDAHDVSATYQIVTSLELMSQTPRDAGDFLELLQERHRVLMAGRPERNPGVFKGHPNYAGATEFVSPQHVVGTLREGWARINSVLDPFHRALMTMFVITECHPFDDGNGRLARIMTNAELVDSKQQRIIIPNCYRNNYLAALNGATNRGGVKGLASVLHYSRRWVTAVDWSDWDRCMADLEYTHAFEDSATAEHSGRRLRLPEGAA